MEMKHCTVIFIILLFNVIGTFQENTTSTEGQDLLRLISSAFRANSLHSTTPLILPADTTTQPPEPLSSQEIPDTAQYDTNNNNTQQPTRKPKFVSVFASNITFDENHTLAYYSNLLQESIPPQHRLEYLEAISDRLRAENKFQNDSYLSEFATIFYRTLKSSRSIPNPWSKKTEKKHLKRFLKYALNSQALTIKKDRDTASTCDNNQPLPFLSKEFYRSLLAHSEGEGYEILIEALENRNVTIPTEQLKDIQCLYYQSYQGMEGGRAYIFPNFDEDWDQRNALFGKPLILSSIRAMVAEVTGKSKEVKVSDFMLTILQLLPEYRSRIEESTKPTKSRKFHDVVQSLQGNLMGVQKTDIFVDVDSKDILMSTGVEAILDVTSDTFNPDKTPVVFDPFNRHDWNKLQLLRLAGIQILDKYQPLFSKMVTDKITQIYSPGRGLSRTFSNAFHHIRLLPTGPLLLQGFEILNSLMGTNEPRDKSTHRNRIKNFKETLLFLRGLYSTNEALLVSLPQQVQILTDPNLNKNLKLMLKYAPAPSSGGGAGFSPTVGTGGEDDLNFAEVGVKDGKLEIRAFPFDIPVNDTFLNMWQFQLGYFKGYSEAWQEPVIKAEILLGNETSGGLAYNWREGQLVYKSMSDDEAGSEDRDTGFWDLSLFPDGQSFQFMYQGKLEMFFKTQYDSNGTLPIGIKGEHHVPHFLPEGFKSAEFFVVPAGDFY